MLTNLSFFPLVSLVWPECGPTATLLIVDFFSTQRHASFVGISLLYRASSLLHLSSPLRCPQPPSNFLFTASVAYPHKKVHWYSQMLLNLPVICWIANNYSVTHYAKIVSLTSCNWGSSDWNICPQRPLGKELIISFVCKGKRNKSLFVLLTKY